MNQPVRKTAGELLTDAVDKLTDLDIPDGPWIRFSNKIDEVQSSIEKYNAQKDDEIKRLEMENAELKGYALRYSKADFDGYCRCYGPEPCDFCEEVLWQTNAANYLASIEQKGTEP